MRLLITWVVVVTVYAGFGLLTTRSVNEDQASFQQAVRARERLVKRGLYAPVPEEPGIDMVFETLLLSTLVALPWGTYTSSVGCNKPMYISLGITWVFVAAQIITSYLTSGISVAVIPPVIASVLGAIAGFNIGELISIRPRRDPSSLTS